MTKTTPFNALDYIKDEATLNVYVEAMTAELRQENVKLKKAIAVRDSHIRQYRLQEEQIERGLKMLLEDIF